MTEVPADTRPQQVTLLRRFVGLMGDWVLSMLVAGMIGRPTQAPWAAPLVLVLEYTFFVGVFTQTPGMWLARIRCVSVFTGGRIGLPRALLRALALALLLPALIMDDRRRGMHDRLADSEVVPA